MVRDARATLPAPSERPARVQASGGNGEGPTLGARITRLETALESPKRQIDAQLRRTGEIRAQLDRAMKAIRLK